MQLRVNHFFDKVKTVVLSRLQQHNFISIVSIKTKLSTVAYVITRQNFVWQIKVVFEKLVYDFMGEYFLVHPVDIT